MPEITEFYRCFGCGREHETHGDAVSCCNVVQHVWRCDCGEEFPSEAKAVRHVQDVNHETWMLANKIESRYEASGIY
jgi:hypothetical protein